MRGWDEQLRARGYRVTPQRQLVLEAVARLDHATPEEIGAQVQQTARGVNISTIYRTLELLEQIGMVTHTHLGHGAPIYHLAADADHVHLVCRDCDRVTEIGPDAIRPLITALEEQPRLRNRRRPSHRLRPLRRLPDGRRCLILVRARCWPGRERCRPAGRTRAWPRTTATRCASSARPRSRRAWWTGPTAASSGSPGRTG